MIKKLTNKQGYVTRKDVVELLHIGENQAYRIFKKLVEDNILVLEGKGRKSKYILAKK